MKEKNNKKLEKDEWINDANNIVSIRVPSESWIKLTPGTNETFPFRTLRLIHGSTTSFLDVNIKPSNDRSAYQIAALEINEVLESPSEKIDALSSDAWTEFVTDSSYLRRCFTSQDNAKGCIYSLVLKRKNNDVMLFGSVALGVVGKAEFEKLVQSMTLNAIHDR